MTNYGISLRMWVYRLFFSPSVLIASNTGMHRRQITDLLDQSIQVHSQCFVVTSDNRYILLCGFWDKSFRVYSTDTGNLIVSLSVTSSLQQEAVRDNPICRTEKKKRHRFIEESFRLCGRRRGWDVSREQH